MLGQRAFLLFALLCFSLVFNHDCVLVLGVAQDIYEIQAGGFLVVSSDNIHERSSHYLITFFSVGIFRF